MVAILISSASPPMFVYDGVTQPAGDEIYLSVEQNPWSQGLSFLLRTTADPFICSPRPPRRIFH